MNAPLITSRFTPEDLLLLQTDKEYELVDGQLVEKKMSLESSWIGGELLASLRNHCRPNQLGWVFPADASYQCFPETGRVRKPDVSLIRRGRLPAERFPEGHCKIRPDLAVEVVSRNDLVDELDEKLGDYRSASIPLVWVIHPRVRQVHVYRSAELAPVILSEEMELSGDDVIPGFRCRVAELFPPAPIEKPAS